MHMVIIHNKDGTIKAIGPLAAYKVAEAYANFIAAFKPNTVMSIYEESRPTNKWGAPEKYCGVSYPFPTESEIHCD